MPLIRRVCLRQADGTLKSARYASRAREGDEWVPVPNTQAGLLLGQQDLGRPTGQHPAAWYGWPRGEVDTRDWWTVCSATQFALVRAHTFTGALLASGLANEVEYVEMHEPWY